MFFLLISGLWVIRGSYTHVHSVCDSGRCLFNLKWLKGKGQQTAGRLSSLPAVAVPMSKGKNMVERANQP